MRILVTGGSGFIGTNLMDLLTTRTQEILNVDVESPPKGEHAQFWSKCDVLDVDELNRRFQGFRPETVIHLAAKTDTTSRDLRDYVANTEGTSNLLEAVRHTPTVTRLIIASTQFTCEPGYIPKHDEDFRPHTAYGESSKREWAPEKTGAIASMEDFERYPWPEPRDIDYSMFDEASSRLPDGMKVIAGLGGGPFISSWSLMGFETFCLALGEDPELAEAVVGRGKSILDTVAGTLADYDCVGAFLLGDDIAYTEGLMVSPGFLRKHLFPWQKSKCKQFCDKGLCTLYHSDGNLEQVLEDILEVGFQGLHPIEPKAMDIRKLKKTIGPRICLLGNVDLGYTLTRGTPEEVRREARQRIQEIAPGGGQGEGSVRVASSPIGGPSENQEHDETE